MSDATLAFTLKVNGGAQAAAEVTKLRTGIEAEVRKATSITDALIGDSNRVIANAQRIAAGAEQAIQSTGSRLAVAQTEAASFGSRLTGMASAAVPAGIALGVVGTAAIGAGAAIFGLVKHASDVGSQLFDLSKKTGLSAESLSALKLAAEQSGSSIEQASQGVVLFQHRLTEAATKSEELRKFFQKLGIDIPADLADPNKALSDLARVLNGPMPQGFNKTTLAQQLMGKSGADLVSTFDTIGGSFDGFLERARQLGVILTESDLKAADNFGDTLDLLGTQAEALANKFALELAPSVTRSLDSMGAALERHRETISATMRAAVESIDQYLLQVDTMLTAAERLIGMGPKLNEMRVGVGGSDVVVPEGVDPIAFRDMKLRELGLDVPGDASFTGAPKTPTELAQTEAEAKKAAAEAAKARGEGLKADATAAEVAYKQASAAAADAYRESGNLVDLIGSLKKAEAERWAARQQQFVDERAEINKRTQSEELTAAELRVKNEEEKMARAAFNLRMAELDKQYTADSLAELQKRHARELELYDLRSREFIERQKALAQSEAITYTEAQKRITAEGAAGFEKRREFLEAEKDAAKGNAEQQAEIIHQLEVLKEQAALFTQEASGTAATATANDLDRLEESIKRVNETLDRMGSLAGSGQIGTPGFNPNQKIPQGAGQESGPRVDPSTLEPPPPGNWASFGQVVTDVANTIGEAVGVSGEIVSNVFSGITAAVNQTVQAFGGLSGIVKNLGEFTKAVVRNIAVMAAINALWEVAQGVAALALAFFWPSMAIKAHLHFQAAALYGVVAAGAGLASAAIGGPSGGGATVTGSAFGGSANAGTASAAGSGYEDNRTKYQRDQDEKNKYTRTEDRRGEVYVVAQPIHLDGREIARAVVRVVKDDGDVRTNLGRSLAGAV